MKEVVPSDGIRLRFSFGDSIRKLIAAGALDPAKYEALYRSRGGVPVWVQRLLSEPSDEPLLFSSQTAPYLLNLLWPLGLAARTDVNKKSPINTIRLPSFASTGGWPLGTARNGYVYFNNVDALVLSADEQKLVLEVATSTFRPCCDNSTFFQDCNHGSALLGLIELAASQGATADELYRTALAANSYWFPDKYVMAAMYFTIFEDRRWSTLLPPVLLSDAFSSSSGWERSVNRPLKAAEITLPRDVANQLACGI